MCHVAAHSFEVEEKLDLGPAPTSPTLGLTRRRLVANIRRVVVLRDRLDTLLNGETCQHESAALVRAM
jgi:hypothetical protein